MSRDPLFHRYVTEVAQLDGQDVVIGMSLLHAVALVGQLQLALRHPDNDGPSAEVAKAYIGRVAEWCQQRGCAATLEVIRRGFDAQYDEPP